MHRAVAGILGVLAIPFGFLTMQPLAGVAIEGTALVLLAHAITGFGPKSRWPVPLELLAIFVCIALVVGLVGFVAWLIPG